MPAAAMTRAQVQAYAEANDIEILLFEPAEHFDPAIVGLVHGFGQQPVVVYDQARVLAAMTKDMGEEDAREWFEFNTIGAYLGPGTPRFLLLLED